MSHHDSTANHDPFTCPLCTLSASPYPHPQQEVSAAVTHPKNSMTLRDWFAGMALQGLLAEGGTSLSQQFMEKKAYEYADAMLRERNR